MDSTQSDRVCGRLAQNASYLSLVRNSLSSGLYMLPFLQLFKLFHQSGRYQKSVQMICFLKSKINISVLKLYRKTVKQDYNKSFFLTSLLDSQLGSSKIPFLHPLKMSVGKPHPFNNSCTVLSRAFELHRMIAFIK